MEIPSTLTIPSMVPPLNLYLPSAIPPLPDLLHVLSPTLILLISNQSSPPLSPIKMSPPSHYDYNVQKIQSMQTINYTLQHSTVTTNLHGSFPYQTIRHSSKNNADTIITCCFNSRSLVSKLSTFQSFVFSTGYDQICVTETWLSDHIFDQEIMPSQYSIYCNDRTTRGGGVMIAIKDTIPVTRFSSPDHLEIITVRLELQNPVLLCCIYIATSFLVLIGLPPMTSFPS